MRIILLRHAETAWTLTGQHTGKTDLELTDAGRREARAVAKVIERVLGEAAFEVVYSSPRKRALETAALSLGPEVLPVVTDLVAEFDYGAYEGLTRDQIERQRPGWNFWEDGCPGGESIAFAAARADRFIELLRRQHPGATICVVSHGHFIRILTARLLTLDARDGRLFGIRTASVAELTLERGAFVVSRWNLTA
jgi:probable phosphoglycerate mutase